jgi:3-deoxy-manno-octulosonate cytidylyltransferase (CMP-KDO synthetase)
MESVLHLKKVLILIPARFKSSRFPGKPLSLIQGKSMIQRVYENCLEVMRDPRVVAECFVVTDDNSIELEVEGFGGKVCRVDDIVQTGSMRIYLAYKRFFASADFDLIVNVQGDEPLLKAESLMALCQGHLNSSFDMATLVRPRKGYDQDFRDPHQVKVIFSRETGACHYFSRAPIPFARQKGEEELWYQHIGVYSFRPASLERFCLAHSGFYENLECLEQLRVLDIGLSIGGYCTHQCLVGVDVPEDILRVEEVLNHGQEEKR